jgi:hypothetical protein
MRHLIVSWDDWWDIHPKVGYLNWNDWWDIHPKVGYLNWNYLWDIKSLAGMTGGTSIPR